MRSQRNGAGFALRRSGQTCSALAEAAHTGSGLPTSSRSERVQRLDTPLALRPARPDAVTQEPVGLLLEAPGRRGPSRGE